MIKYLKRFLPSIAWISDVPRSWKVDVTAGIGVAVVLIPQAMAYSHVAGVPASVGLYSAVLPLFIGALWGSSRFLSTGPTAVVSLMTFAGVASVVNPEADSFLSSVILVTLMVGLFQLLFAVLKLGKMIQLISHSVIIGFSTAAALLILISQLKQFFPAEITSHSHHVFYQLWEQLLYLDYINWIIPLDGIVSLLVIGMGKKWKK